MPTYVSGEMTIAGAWVLERPEPKYPSPYHCIPAGIYKLELYPSPKFQRIMPRLVDVPGCPYCEIHWANHPADLEGCLGVGTMRDQGVIYNSREKFGELFPILEAAIKTEGADIQVLDIPEFPNAQPTNAPPSGPSAPSTMGSP